MVGYIWYLSSVVTRNRCGRLFLSKRGKSLVLALGTPTLDFTYRIPHKMRITSLYGVPNAHKEVAEYA